MEKINSIKLPDGNTYAIEDANALTKQQITNCVTEIPQDIKLELNNGVLTLKAGSKVYVPNGFEADGTTKKFDEVVIESDIIANEVISTAEDTQYFVTYDSSRKKVFTSVQTKYCESGTTNVTTNVTGYFYNTSTNILTFHNGASYEEYKYSLPLGITYLTGGKPTSLKQVFNGFGYIGSIVFVTKGVKGLIPNGRNEDGTLNNIEFSTSKVITYKHGFSNNYTGPLHYFVYGTDIITDNTGYYDSYNEPVDWNYKTWFNKQENKILYKQNGEIFTVSAVMFCTATLSNNSITSFTPKLPFRAVDYSDKSTVSGWGMPSNKYIDLTLGASGTTYTAPANGYIGIAFIANTSGVLYVYVNTPSRYGLSIPYNNGTWAEAILPVKRGNPVAIQYSGAPAVQFFYFIYAEGEV